MKIALLSCCLLLCLATVVNVRADDDTPVPPEVKSLAEAFMTAFKAADDAAMLACWHAPAVLAKVKQEAVVKEAATSPTDRDPAKEHDRELKRQEKNLAVSRARAAQLREVLTRRFGALDQLKLDHLELDEEDDAAPDQPAFDGLEFHLVAADGTTLVLGIDDAVKVNGEWKFRGRLEDEITIKLPSLD